MATKKPIEVLPSVVPHIPSLITLALEKDASVEVLRDLYNLQKEYDADQARKAFHAAIVAFQAECPAIPRVKQGAKSKYAPLEYIEQIIKPIREKHGLAVHYRTVTGDRTMKGDCIVSHVSGHSEILGDAEFPMLDVITSRQGKDVTNWTQAVAGTMQYVKRYALANALNLTFVDEDNDGQRIVVLASEHQVVELEDLLITAGINAAAICKKYNVAKLEEMTASQIEIVISQCKQYIAQHDSGE